MTIAWLSRTVPVAPDELAAALGAPYRVVVDGAEAVTETPDIVVATTLDPPELLRSLGSRPAGVRAAVLPAPGVPLTSELWTAARPDAVTALAGVADVAGLVRGLATAQVWLGGGGAVTGAASDTQVLGADRPWWDAAPAAAPVVAAARRSRWTRRRTVPLALAAVAALVLALVLFATLGGNSSSNASSVTSGATQNPGTTGGGSDGGGSGPDGSGTLPGDGTVPTTPSTPGAPGDGTTTGPQAGADALISCLRQQGIVVATPGQDTEGMRQATRAEVRKALAACRQQLGGSDGTGGDGPTGTGGGTTTGTTT